MEAHWRNDELPPTSIRDGRSLARDDAGIRLVALECDAREEGLVYELEAVNPFDDTFELWAFTGLNGREQAQLWGLYAFDLPPGTVRVHFPDVLEDGQRRDIVRMAVDEVGGEIVACSVVLLGIANDPDTPVVHPVIADQLRHPIR